MRTDLFTRQTVSPSLTVPTTVRSTGRYVEMMRKGGRGRGRGRGEGEECWDGWLDSHITSGGHVIQGQVIFTPTRHDSSLSHNTTAPDRPRQGEGVVGAGRQGGSRGMQKTEERDEKGER